MGALRGGLSATLVRNQLLPLRGRLRIRLLVRTTRLGPTVDGKPSTLTNILDLRLPRERCSDTNAFTHHATTTSLSDLPTNRDMLEKRGLLHSTGLEKPACRKLAI